MWVLLCGLSVIWSKDAYVFLSKECKSIIVAYAHARKRMHYSFTFLVFSIEAIAIFSVHEIWAHLALTGGVTSWEALLIKIGEEESL